MNIHYLTRQAQQKSPLRKDQYKETQPRVAGHHVFQQVGNSRNTSKAQSRISLPALDQNEVMIYNTHHSYPNIPKLDFRSNIKGNALAVPRWTMMTLLF